MSEVEHRPIDPDNALEDVAQFSALLHHEAAHAVLAHHLGLDVEAVTVEEHDDGISGFCTVHGEVPPWHYIREAALSLAGRYADWRWLNYGEDHPLIPFEEFMANTCGYSAGDTRNVLETLEKAVEFYAQTNFPEEAVADLGRLDTLRGCYWAAAREARWEVEIHWPEIAAVASALMDAAADDRPLTGVEVKEIIESVEAEEVA